MLGSDVLVVKALRFLGGQLHDLPGAIRESFVHLFFSPRQRHQANPGAQSVSDALVYFSTPTDCHSVRQTSVASLVQISCRASDGLTTLLRYSLIFIRFDLARVP